MKTEVHALGFHAFAQQTLFHARCRAGCVPFVRMDFIDKLRARTAQSPDAFCLQQNRQDRRTAVRRIKFSVKAQLCRTFTPLTAPYPRAPSLAPKGQFTLQRRGLVRCADERGLSPLVSPEPGAYLRGTASPLESESACLSPAARSYHGRRARENAGGIRSDPPVLRCWRPRGSCPCPFLLQLGR